MTAVSSWDDRAVGTWRLSAHITPTGGEVNYFGDYGTFRTCVEIARILAREKPSLNRFSASFKRSNERKGSMVDGYSRPISLEPPEHDPSTEFTLSDGRTVWLGDVDEMLRACMDTLG